MSSLQCDLLVALGPDAVLGPYSTERMAIHRSLQGDDPSRVLWFLDRAPLQYFSDRLWISNRAHAMVVLAHKRTCPSTRVCRPGSVSMASTSGLHEFPWIGLVYPHDVDGSCDSNRRMDDLHLCRKLLQRSAIASFHWCRVPSIRYKSFWATHHWLWTTQEVASLTLPNYGSSFSRFVSGSGCNTPTSKAKRTSSARECIPSFRIRRARYDSTVLTLNVSIPAIC